MIFLNFFRCFFWRRKIKDDILLVDKPKGMSSFDVIRILRRKLGIRKMGHAGTLDPLASGLLIVGVEKGTKKLNDYMRLPKTYLMEILLGKQTTTGDMEGEIIAQKEVGEIDKSEIEKVLKSLQGDIELEAPIYSAIKFKGRPLYDYARKGIDIGDNSFKRKTKIYKLNLLDSYGEDKYWILKVEMDCSHGTYARSVAEEIGRRLGCPATIKELRRTKIGDFLVEKAIKI